MKAKKIGALLLAGVMAASMVSATSVSAADAKRVCFVARASADTFAAWLTTEMKKQAENYGNCVSISRSYKKGRTKICSYHGLQAALPLLTYL